MHQNLIVSYLKYGWFLVVTSHTGSARTVWIGYYEAVARFTIPKLIHSFRIPKIHLFSSRLHVRALKGHEIHWPFGMLLAIFHRRSLYFLHAE